MIMSNPIDRLSPPSFQLATGLRATGLALLLAMAALPACRGSEPATPAQAAEIVHTVDVAALKVGVQDLETALQITGSLAAQTRVEIRATLAGKLATIGVDIGDRVRRGQVIATLDRREIDAQVDAAQAAVNVAHAGVEAADAALANATLEQERARNLFDRGALPKQRLDAADTGRRSAAAQRDLAAANLAQAEAAARRATELQRDASLTSPVDGVVVERHYDAGSLVGPGNEPIVVIADVRVMKLEAGVSELEAGRVRVGMPARVSAQALPGKVFDGRVAAIAPEVDARNRHFRIEVRVSNPDATLVSGMYGSAAIPLERAAQVLAVPRDAVTTRDGKRVALRINGDTIQAVPVTEGLTDGIITEIASGLSAGDAIVSDARQDVAIGAKVNPVFSR
jgi:RND family efflux transporter MFP subunit